MTTVRLYSLAYSDARTYLVAVAFIAGNILLPQLFHLLPQGGMTWLPIYFFTLIGAYKYGARVGLLTAIASPVVNHLLFGMPDAAMLTIVLLKSCLLAGTAAWTAARFRSVSVLLLLAVVAAYQSLGFLGEWLLTENVHIASEHLRLGLPGMALQVVGGYFFIHYLIRK